MMRRVFYHGTVTFPYGFHTGLGRGLTGPDRPLFRNPDGTLELSGSSVAGVLRRDLGRISAAAGRVCATGPNCECPVCRLMGPQAPPDRRAPEAALRASRLYVRAGTAASISARIRDHVGIDRKTGTAANKRKYDVELVDQQIAFPLELRLDLPKLDDEAIALLEVSLHRFEDGWFLLGGRTSAGQGLARLDGLKRSEVNLGDRTQLMAHLIGVERDAGATDVSISAAASALAPTPAGRAVTLAPDAAWAQIRLALELHFPLPFLVNDPAEAALQGFDHAYLRRTSDGGLLLPGSSLRGALRSRAERILRTLGGDRAACEIHVEGEACHERILKENGQRRDAGEEPLTFEQEVSAERMCGACRAFGCGRIVSSVKVTDFPQQGLRDATSQGVAQEFVAVDRFTGGAAPKLKFDALACTQVTCAGEIHLDIGADRLQSWGLGLVALTLRDLLLGDIPLGFGSAKGFGEYAARVTGIKVYCKSAPPPLRHVLGESGVEHLGAWRPLSVTSPAEAQKAAGGELSAAMVDWVKALHHEFPPPAPLQSEASR